jgi:hypothetical protein
MRQPFTSEMLSAKDLLDYPNLRQEKDHTKGSVKILFISDQDSHDQIFNAVLTELTQIGNIQTKILHTKLIFNRPLSILFSYTYELRMFKKIIDEYQPDVLVIAYDGGINAEFIRICKLRKIPSVLVQDGIMTKMHLKGLAFFLSFDRFLFWRIISAITNISIVTKLTIFIGRQWAIPVWGTGGSSVIAAMGQFSKKILVSRGVPYNRVIVTGFPLFDKIKKVDSNSSAINPANETISKRNKPLILLITQPFVEDGVWTSETRTRFFESIINAVSKARSRLVVKVHPREESDCYLFMARKHVDSDITITENSGLDQLLLSSDILITVSSTVGLWAIAYGKPLLVANSFPITSENPLEDIGLVVNEIQQLPNEIERIAKDENWRMKIIAESQRSLLYYVHRLDGNASLRVAKLIIRVAEKGGL